MSNIKSGLKATMLALQARSNAMPVDDSGRSGQAYSAGWIRAAQFIAQPAVRSDRNAKPVIVDIPQASVIASNAAPGDIAASILTAGIAASPKSTTVMTKSGEGVVARVEYLSVQEHVANAIRASTISGKWSPSMQAAYEAHLDECDDTATSLDPVAKKTRKAKVTATTAKPITLT